jgi:hypothetical protein
VRSGQYWRLENLASFDEFLAKHSPALNGRSYLNLEAFAPAGSWAGVCGVSDHTELEADDEVA